MKYLLFGTSGCHLCELAEEIIAECQRAETDFSVKLIDIAEQTEWQKDFATIIPVLMHEPSQRFINWPFNKNDVLTFIQQHHD